MKKLSKTQWNNDEKDWWSMFHQIMNKQWLLNDTLNEYFRKPIEKDKINYLYLKDGYVLDIGCGSGHFSHKIHSLGMNVIGIDFSIDQITKALEDYKPIGLNRLNFICSNFLEWNYINYQNQFDSIHIEAFLHHLHDEDIEEFFKIIAKLLKPEGKIYLFEPVYYDKLNVSFIKLILLRIYSSILSIITNKLPNIMGIIDEALINQKSLGYCGMSPHERALNMNMIEKLMQKNGLRVINITPERYKSIGFFLSLMTLNSGLYKKLIIKLAPIIISIDEIIFKLFPYKDIGSKYDFLLYSIKIQKTNDKN